ncbi:MAG TPA: RNA polymerase subunit sigma [Clostridiales bacterium]|nr:RNA polymerase subunit sigma [Clostridiales bacterium]
MNQNIMQNDVMLVQNGEMDVNRFIIKYKPFIYASIYQFNGRFIVDGDELTTIGMMAFVEALENYETRRGSFYNYSKLVIRSRLIDYHRKMSKLTDNEILMTENESELDYQNSRIDTINAINSFNEMEDNFFRKEEIAQLSEELSHYDITFKDLEKLSPKKAELREKYIRCAQFIVDNEELLSRFLTSRRLPTTEISNQMMITRKQIDRARKYIIALVLIKRGNYAFLSEYIKLW